MRKWEPTVASYEGRWLIPAIVIVTLVLIFAAMCYRPSDAKTCGPRVEQFIPIGQSPGVSGVTAIMGRIDELDPIDRVIWIGTTMVQVNPETSIYIDRSRMKKSNLVASFNDLEIGQVVEVRLEAGPSVIPVAQWIKISAMEIVKEKS